MFKTYLLPVTDLLCASIDILYAPSTSCTASLRNQTCLISEHYLCGMVNFNASLCNLDGDGHLSFLFCPHTFPTKTCTVRKIMHSAFWTHLTTCAYCIFLS